MMSDSPVLITGGAQRLGLAIAESLLQQHIPVIVTYRTRREGVELLESKGATTVNADFSEDEGIHRLIRQIKGEYSGLRAIIHNASDWVAEKPGVDLSSLMRRMMQIHVNTPYQLNLAFRGVTGIFVGV